MIGGRGYCYIECVYEIRRTLSFGATYTNCAEGDIGKQVLGATTEDTGTLISYSNTAKTWVVEMDDSGDLFDVGEAISIPTGTGAGTTTEASVLTVEDFFLFTSREEMNIKVKFEKVYDTSDIPMEKGKFKRFTQKHRPWVMLSVLADDDVTTLSGIKSDSLQMFLMNMHNWTELIRIKPRNDKPQKYWFKLKTDWDWKNPFDIWYGLEGIEIFRGDELVDIDLQE